MKGYFLLFIAELTRTCNPETLIFADLDTLEKSQKVRLVPEAGIEPACPFYGRQILSLLCLPISPLGHAKASSYHTFEGANPKCY